MLKCLGSSEEGNTAFRKEDYAGNDIWVKPKRKLFRIQIKRDGRTRKEDILLIE